MEVFIILGIIMVYFLPWVIARTKNKKNTAAIVTTNLFFGWTVIGWILALIWACMED